MTTPKQTATKDPKKTPKESLSNKRKRQSTSTKSDGPSSSQSLRKKAKVDYTEETKSEYFSEAKTSTENISDEEDFQIPTPKRRKSEEIRVVEPVPGDSSSTAKKGQ